MATVFACVALWPVGAAAAPPDAIRIGGPSAPDEKKVAIVVSGAPLVGERFTVHAANGRRVDSGRLQPADGDPSPWDFAARADFSDVERPGRYTIRVGDLVSPAWVVERSANRALLRRTLRVFELNADGDEPNPVFGPSHLNDANAPIVGGPTDGGTIDVEGGWRDAGDAIKFTTTTGIASAMLDYAALLDPRDAERLQSLSDIGIRWLVKAHPRGSQTFIAQVADECDHIGFRHFETDDASPNPALSRRIAYGEAGSGPLGAAAAALALAAARDETGRARRARLGRLAREWYERGKEVSAPGPVIDNPNCPDSFPQPGDPALGFYSDWQGFMALAAAALYTLTGDEDYLDDAQQFLSDPALDFTQGVNPYFFVAPLAAADLCGGLGFEEVDHPVVELACDRLEQTADAKVALAQQTPFVTPGEFFFGWVAGHTANAALWAAAEETDRLARGLDLAAEARDYLMGRNPWGAIFVTGPEPNAARHPYHPVFLKGDPVVLGNGLVVGGPAAETQFKDFGLHGQLNPNDRFAPFNPTYSFPPFNTQLGPNDDTPTSEKIIYEDSYDANGEPYNFINGETGLAYSAPTVLLLAQLIDG